MHREMQDNFDCKNFEIIHKSKIKPGATTLPSVWQLRRKRHILTQKIKKYKARINIDKRQTLHSHLRPSDIMGTNPNDPCNCSNTQMVNKTNRLRYGISPSSH